MLALSERVIYIQKRAHKRNCSRTHKRTRRGSSKNYKRKGLVVFSFPLSLDTHTTWTSFVVFSFPLFSPLVSLLACFEELFSIEIEAFSLIRSLHLSHSMEDYEVWETVPVKEFCKDSSKSRFEHNKAPLL